MGADDVDLEPNAIPGRLPATSVQRRRVHHSILAYTGCLHGLRIAPTAFNPTQSVAGVDQIKVC